LINTGRRRILRNSLAAMTTLGAGGMLPTRDVLASASPVLRKQIPGKDDSVPVIGMGTWITFDVPAKAGLRAERAAVLQRFVELGGGMIDSSPMYGFAEEVLGEVIPTLNTPNTLFNASKIWTSFGNNTNSQMVNTEKLWGVKPMDLMYVHNLRNWQDHLPKLQNWKDEGRIRYVGLSTSHGRRHSELENLLNSFFQAMPESHYPQ